MTCAVHLSDDLLIRSIDAEVSTDLSFEERVYAERHLAACQFCRQRRQQWAESLDLVETGVASVIPPVPANSRMRLAAALQDLPIAVDADLAGSRQLGPGLATVSVLPGEVNGVGRTARAKVGKATWWQLAAAAAIACAVLAGLALQPHSPFAAVPPSDYGLDQIADSDYLPLPYSSAVLPTAEAQVVQVEMPVSALRDAGIEVSSTDEEYVGADILLGLDGQPQGIRLLNASGSALN